MKPIQEFSDEELVDELMARYDDIAIGARRVLTTSNDPDAQRKRWWKGDIDVCIGLVQEVSQDLINSIWNKKEVVDGED